MNWNNKRYHTLDYELKKQFGQKVIKLSINGGFTCPNRDGTLGYKGCIFCSEKGSGDFAGECGKSIESQINEQIELLKDKWTTNSYIAYFQSFTNTYGPVEVLRSKYNEALKVKNVKGLAIATRPDCIDEEIVKLLADISETKGKYLWVELGLQTIHEKSAKLINRGYDLKVFEEATKLLDKYNIKYVVHIIFGIPNESYNEMMETIRYVAKIKPWGVKIHLMHVLKNTELAKLYEKTNFKLLEKEEYIKYVCDALELLPSDVVIHRITGDGAKKDLIGPWWSLNKRSVLNGIDKELISRNSYQGKLYRI